MVVILKYYLLTKFKDPSLSVLQRGADPHLWQRDIKQRYRGGYLTSSRRAINIGPLVHSNTTCHSLIANVPNLDNCLP